jgi:murein L,D-transpeptidase YcbB/YkuD
MNKKYATFAFAIFAVLIMTTGCARGGNKQVKALQAQVGVITDELVRLDEALQETRSSIQAEEGHRNQLQSDLSQSEGRLGSLYEEEKVIEGMYRTPSGFTLPSAQIQQALQGAGYYKGALDGKVGPNTRAAIKAFQADNGLTADGVCGRKTWAQLKSYLGK